MRNLRGTYVHRGDGLRRRRRIRQMLYVAGFLVATALVLTHHETEPASAAAAEIHHASHFFSLGGDDHLRSDLETTKGELNLVRAQYDRTHRILGFSSRYQVPGDLAAIIFDTSLEEGIDPDLAFRLVKLESGFDDHAVSPVGAVGLTQVMPSTARFFRKGITREGLYDRKTNLHVGLRYLHTLLEQYNGNVKLALLVYNRGETAVRNAIAAGQNPTNGYDRILTKGYKGKGVID